MPLILIWTRWIMKKRLILKIYGFVQGVNYRYYSSQYAKKLGITGWVQNEADGTVSLVAEGEERNLQKLLDYCYNGIKYARVDKIETHWHSASGEFIDFEVRY